MKFKLYGKRKDHNHIDENNFLNNSLFISPSKIHPMRQITLLSMELTSFFHDSSKNQLSVVRHFPSSYLDGKK